MQRLCKASSTECCTDLRMASLILPPCSRFIGFGEIITDTTPVSLKRIRAGQCCTNQEAYPPRHRHTFKRTCCRVCASLRPMCFVTCNQGTMWQRQQYTQHLAKTLMINETFRWQCRSLHLLWMRSLRSTKDSRDQAFFGLT